MIRLFLLFGTAAILLVTCRPSKRVINDVGSLDHLISMMEGSFDSKSQSVRDSDYYDITLHMVEIWPKKQGRYLYVEQSVSSMPTKPYRQRVYQVMDLGGGKYESKVFEIDGQETFVGKWKDPDFFNVFDKSLLIEREGCSVYLIKQGDKYIGSTDGRSCLSSLRGATYAVSKVIISPIGIDSWDQGFDEKGVQVWGAVKGGYEFRPRPKF